MKAEKQLVEGIFGAIDRTFARLERDVAKILTAPRPGPSKREAYAPADRLMGEMKAGRGARRRARIRR